MSAGRTRAAIIVLLAGAVVALQAIRDEYAPAQAAGAAMYLRSPEFAKRAMLSYDSLAADVYWIRALQHFGRTKLSSGKRKEYELLFPLLDMATSLDPRFNIAYRFGAIFLAEPSPGGAGRPDQAIALLQKGLESNPSRWEFAEDIGFVYYWWAHDYDRAADWFTRAGDIKGAPGWLRGLAAVTRAKGGDRETSRRLWTQIANDADETWLHGQALFRLRQLEAMDQIEVLERAVRSYRERTGTWPDTWRAPGFLKGAPVDPDGYPYRLDPATGAVSVDPTSTINPLPVEHAAP